MTQRILATLALIALAAAAACTNDDAAEAKGVDPELARTIAGIKANDNHAHPVRPTAAGETPDNEFDALPVDNLEPQSDPVRQRPASPEVIAAGRELFGGDKAAAIRAH